MDVYTWRLRKTLDHPVAGEPVATRTGSSCGSMSRPSQAVADDEHRKADVLSPPPASVAQLATHFTSQLNSGPMGATIALALNTCIAPFDKLAARQAFNDAINWSTVAALNGRPLAVQPTCQVLPPSMPGYRPYCPCTILPSSGGAWTAPDLALARRLVRESRTQGDHVRVLYRNEHGPSPSSPSPGTARYLVSVLGRIGYRASLQRQPDVSLRGSLLIAGRPASR